MTELFDTRGTWYKGNLHMHTLRSDGCLSPEEAAALYRKAGYDFIALTDHWVQSEEKHPEHFLMLSGCEWDTGNMMQFPVFHIVGVGMRSPVALSRSFSLPPQEIIDAINAAGGVAVLAHPAWSVTDPADVMNLRGLCGAEIYNTVSGLPWNGQRSDSSLYFDLWASQGRFIRCMAADDSHYYNGEQTRSFIMVNAGELTADAIREALRRGNFYATQGPRFHSIRMDGRTIEVGCSEVRAVVFYSNTVWCPDRVAIGKVRSALYNIKPTDRYVRIELIDSDGKRAWSSPIPVNATE